MRAEHQLLVCIARKSLDESASERLRTLTKNEIDWEYLIRSAAEHGLLPLMASHLYTHARDVIPQPILQRLRTCSLDSSQSNLYLLRELLRILLLLGKNGIRTLAFKGAVLGEMLFGDVGLRQAGDLDILIAKEQFRRAKDLLESNGYRMEPQLTAAQETSHLRFHCEIQFLHQDQFSVVDLHWGLTPKSFPFFLGFEDLWARRKSIWLAGQAIETFSHEDLLLYLCMHGAKHYWQRLEWIAAVAELIRSSPALDWSVVLRRAKESRGEKILALGLLLANSLFAVELRPEAFEAMDSNEALKRCAEKVRERLFMNETNSASQIEMARLNLQFMDRRRDAVGSFLRSVLVPTISDWRAVHLPDQLYPLYYGFRPFRLLSKYGGRRKVDEPGND